MSVRRERGPASISKAIAALDGLEGLEGKVGWFESATYKDGTPVAYVATIHEHGAGPVPARPFMRPAVAQYGASWMDLLGQGAKAALNGSVSPEAVLDAVTLKAAGDVGKAIRAVTSPALKPMTIKRKGFDKPLVDSGQMLQSVTGKVERTA
jgi:phage gpG-like protein